MTHTGTHRRPSVARPAWLTGETWPFPVSSIDVDGARVAVTDTGTGPTLLFVNGGQWSFLWRDVIQALSDRHRCVTLDPLGFGLSDRVGPDRQTMATLRDTVGAAIDHLDVDQLTLVLHDIAGPAGLAAAASRSHRIRGLVALNTFGWRPSGALFPVMLRIFGSAPMRILDGAVQFLPIATAAGFRRFDRPSRRAFRRGLDRPATQAMHRLFASARARRSPQIYDQIDGILNRQLAQVPLLTIFGAWGDYLRFQRRWREARPDVHQVKIPRGFHFPMVDNPPLVADTIATWHTQVLAEQRPNSTSTPHPAGDPGRPRSSAHWNRAR